jgi:hypothetical protein
MLNVVVSLAACDSATTQQSSASTTTPTSFVNVRPNVSPPPGSPVFPDLNGLTPADIAAYSGTNWHHDDFVQFKTDTGVTCFAYVFGGTRLGGIQCDSRAMPGFPSNAAGESLRQTEPPGTVFADSVMQSTSNVPFEFRITTNDVDQSPKTLPAGQRLVLNDTGCGAGDGGLLACIGGDGHGFVLSPKGSWAF